MTSDVIPKYIQKFHFRLQVYYDAADNSIWKKCKNVCHNLVFPVDMMYFDL